MKRWLHDFYKAIIKYLPESQKLFFSNMSGILKLDMEALQFMLPYILFVIISEEAEDSKRNILFVSFYHFVFTLGASFYLYLTSIIAT